MDKRPCYLWVFAILANVGTYLAIVCMAISDGHHGIDAWISSIMIKEVLLLIGGSFFVSIVPVWLSGINFKYRNYLGFGIPLFIISGSFWHFFTCDGWFCNVIDVAIIFGGGIFILFYLLGIYLRKWNVKVVTVLLWIEIIFITLFTLFNIYNSYQNKILERKLNSLQKEAQVATDPADIARTCDSFPEDTLRRPLRSECWQRAMVLYPNTDVCSWSKEADSKAKCLFYEGLLNQNICEGKDPLSSYEKRDNLNENTLLVECWKDKSKMYPELNICQWVYEWNSEKCMEAINIGYQ